MINKLTELVDAVKTLFKDPFIDNQLDAIVNLPEKSYSPWDSFVKAKDALIDAINDFKEAMKDNELSGWEKVKKAIEVLGAAIDAAGKLIKAVLENIGSTISNIGSLLQKDWGELYKTLLLSGYMRHNLPCRLNRNQMIPGIVLQGTGLTGFDFNDIPKSKDGNSTFKGAELEYILAGTNDEKMNQMASFYDLYFLRMVLDLPSIFSDNGVRTAAMSASIASWIVYVLYIVIEPLCDTLILVNGGTVQLIRDKCFLTAGGLLNLTDSLENAYIGTSSGGENGDMKKLELGYKTHMLLLIFLKVSDEMQMKRLSDLVKLEAAAYYGSFNIYKAYTTVKISADVTFKPFFDFASFNGGAPMSLEYNIKNTVSY